MVARQTLAVPFPGRWFSADAFAYGNDSVVNLARPSVLSSGANRYLGVFPHYVSPRGVVGFDGGFPDFLVCSEGSVYFPVFLCERRVFT